MTFTRTEVRGACLVFFQKRGFPSFISEIFESGKSLGRKVHCFNSLVSTKFPRFSNFLCILTLSFLKTFQNDLNYASTSNIGEVIKFYNLGNKSFETDFKVSFQARKSEIRVFSIVHLNIHNF